MRGFLLTDVEQKLRVKKLKIKWIRQKFISHARTNEPFKANLYKNANSLILTGVSAIFLVFWGIDLIYINNPTTNSSYIAPVKLLTILIGYGIPITDFIFDYRILKRKLNYITKRHNK